MPLSHLCQGCGLDLAEVRASPDPHYGLRVVTCPACRTSCTRHRDPLIAGWRRARRITGGMVLLAAHTAILAPALLFSSGFALTVAGRRIDPTSPVFSLDSNLVSTLMLVSTAAAAGLWMGLAMPHRSPLARAAAWAGAHGVLCGLFAAIVFGTRGLRPVDPADLLEMPWTYAAWVAVAAGTSLIILAAELLARPGRWLIGLFTAALFRWRQHRARIRRSGT